MVSDCGSRRNDYLCPLKKSAFGASGGLKTIINQTYMMKKGIFMLLILVSLAATLQA